MGLAFTQLKSDREWRAATGLSAEKFNQLASLFSAIYVKKQGVTIEQAQINLAQKFCFSTTDELLFFILFCLKNPTTLTVNGLIFDIPQSTANYNFKKGLELLELCLTENAYIPAREFADKQSFLKYLSQEPILTIDVTELKVERPREDAAQNELYSGKKNSIVEKY